MQHEFEYGHSTPRMFTENPYESTSNNYHHQSNSYSSCEKLDQEDEKTFCSNISISHTSSMML